MTTSDHRPPGERRRVARDSLALATGSAVTGLLAYVFFVLTTRSLGAASAAPVSVLWSYWAMAAAVLTFTVQHWIIATLARERHEATVARSLPGIALAGVVLSVLSGAGAFAARSTLFDDRGVAFPAMVAAVTAGSLFTGVVRGALAGRRRYGASASFLVAENAVRVAGAAVAAATGAGAAAFGVALALGPLSGLIWVRALRFQHTHGQARPVRNPLALMSGIAGGSLVAQVVLNGGPVALAVVGGSPTEVTALFIALAVWRAPYLVALGVAPQLTDWLARIVGQQQHTHLARLRVGTVLATAAAAGLAALVAVALMPWLLRTIFGPDVVLGRSLLVVLGVGTAVGLGNLLLLLLMMALDRPRVATGAWAGALLVAGCWLVTGIDQPLPRVVLAFLLSQLTAFVVLLVLGTPGAPAGRAGRGPGRGAGRGAR